MEAAVGATCGGREGVEVAGGTGAEEATEVPG